MEATMMERDSRLPPLTDLTQPGGSDTAAFHAGDGVLLSVDDKAGRLVVTYGPQCRHVLILHGRTRIVDETGRKIPPAGLRAGDEIRGECIVAGSRAVATEIRVLRRATAS
jgi:hypothetical protein